MKYHFLPRDKPKEPGWYRVWQKSNLEGTYYWNGKLWATKESGRSNVPRRLNMGAVAWSDDPSLLDKKMRWITEEECKELGIRYFAGHGSREQAGANKMPKLKRYKQEARVVRHQSAIIDFFLKNQNARDHEVHVWARSLGMSPEALEGEIFHLLSSLLRGVGKHANVPDEAFDPKELEMGIKVELEHTDNADVAKIIAKDHLMEIPDYYSRLTVMEEGG